MLSVTPCLGEGSAGQGYPDGTNARLAKAAATSYRNTAASGQAFQAANGVLSVTPRPGEGSAGQGYPDGTNARLAKAAATSY